MKQMTFVLITVFTVAISSTVKAQSSAFLKAGVNFANISYKENGSVDDSKMLVGFHAGIQGDLPIAPVLSIQPGLFFTTKGAKTQYGQPDDATYYKATSNPMYIELPVNLVFKAPVTEQTKFFVGAGPYVAMGIAGKNKTEGKVFGVAFSSNENIEWSNDDPTTTGTEENAGYGIMKRFDYGLNGTAGVEGNKAIISVNYGYGLAKLQSGSNSSEDDKNKHRVLSLTIGFKL